MKQYFFPDLKIFLKIFNQISLNFDETRGESKRIFIDVNFSIQRLDFSANKF